jgi:FkbM family methyltransferase
MTFVDVGGNVGLFTLHAAMAVGPQGREHSFEPHPREFAILQSNVARVANIDVHRVAVGAQAGRLNLHLSGTNPGRNSFSSANVVGKLSSPIVVEVVSLDDFVESSGPMTHEVFEVFVKIDVEGAEGMVLAGAERLCTRAAVSLLIEFWPDDLRKLGTEPAAILEWLDARGFRVFRVEERGMRLAELARDDFAGAARSTNICMVFATKDTDLARGVIPHEQEKAHRRPWR